MNKMKFFANTSLLLLCFTVSIFAAPGDPDPTFNGGSPVNTAYGLANDEAQAVAVQPDGKLLVLAGGYRKNAVLRYNTNGTPDDTFGSGGTVYIPSSANKFRIFVLADGKIVVYLGFSTLRLNPNGSYDTSFSDDGILNTHGEDLALQSDGKMLLGYSYLYQDGRTDFGVKRINTDGSADISFGEDGLTKMDAEFQDRLNSLAVQADGKILAAGFTRNFNSPNGKDFAVVRFNPDGSPDLSWGKNGRSITHYKVMDEIHEIEINSTGEIVAIGASGNADSGGLMTFVKYRTDGSLEPTFCINGIAPYQWPAGGRIALQPDNKIVASIPGITDFRVLRLTPDGYYDPSFDADGHVITDLVGNDSLKDVALMPDGRIAAVGGNFRNNNEDVATVIYLPDATLDPSFAGNGMAFADISDAPVIKTITRVQPDGKILTAAQVGGIDTVTNGQSYYFALSRLNSDGSPDKSFGNGSKIYWHNRGRLGSMALQSDGKILVATGEVSPFHTYSASIFRFNPNGNPDLTFGTNGKLLPHGANSQADCFPSDMIVQPDDKILIAAAYNHNIDMAVMRLNADGSMDRRFDRDGMAFIDVGGAYESSYAIALRPDGKILMMGFFNKGSQDKLALAQFNTDGSLDGGFGDQGVVRDAPISANYPSSITLQSDGKILLLESAVYNIDTYLFPRSYYTTKVTLIRYNADGGRDTGFGVDGIVQYSPPSGSSLLVIPAGAVQQADGKIIFAGKRSLQGYGGTPPEPPPLGFAKRYDASGNPDDSQPALPGLNQECDSIVLDGSGNLVLTGPSPYYAPDGGTSVVISRYLTSGGSRGINLTKRQ